MLRQIKRLPVLMLLLASIVSAQSVGDSINNGSSGGGLPSGGSVGQVVVNTGSGAGTWQGGLTVYVPAGTSGIAATPVAGTTYLITGNDSEPAAITVSANNVTVQCYPGVKITRSGTTDLFDVSGSNFTLKGCILDGASQSLAGTGPLVNITGSSALITRNVFQNTGTTNPQMSTVWLASGQNNQVVYNSFPALQADSGIEIGACNACNVDDTIIDHNQFLQFGPSTNLYALSVELQLHATAGTARRLRLTNNTIIMNSAAGDGYGMHAVNDTGHNVDWDNVRDWDVSYNKIQLAANLGNGFCGLLKEMSWGHFDHNVCDDGGFTLHETFEVDDIYNSTINANVIALPGGVPPIGINILVAARNAVVGNTIVGSNGGVGLIYQTDASFANAAASNSTIADNVITLKGSSTTCILVDMNTNNATAGGANNNILTGNNCAGDGSATQTGIFLETAGGTSTTDGNRISDNIFSGLNGTGSIAIKVGTGVTNTAVGPESFNTATTKWSFSSSTLLTDFSGVSFANIPANLANGSMLYVSDSTIANPCAGSGTGAMLKRLNGVSVCN